MVHHSSAHYANMRRTMQDLNSCKMNEKQLKDKLKKWQLSDKHQRKYEKAQKCAVLDPDIKR
jgi:hypothetical protein